jgi:hypothetical protein
MPLLAESQRDAIVPVKIRRNQFVADFDCPGRVDA